jgi:hypothetical protein
MMKFLRAFVKNLAFVLLLLILQTSVMLATCLDDVVMQPDSNSHAHQSSQNNAHDEHTDLKQCHINASDGSGGHTHFTVLEDSLSSIDVSDLAHLSWTESFIDELSLLIKSLSLAPPLGPPRAV